MIIGMGYKARQGKDTCCNALVESRGAKKYGFADRLKYEVTGWMQCAHLYASQTGIDPDDTLRVWDAGFLYWIKVSRPEWVVPDVVPDMSDPLLPLGKHRTLCQWWGTDHRRKENENYWVRRLDIQIKQDNPKYAVISDVRFPNEFDWIKSQGGVTVKVMRPGYSIPSTHLSECALDGYNFDYTLVGFEGDVEGLKRAAIRLFDLVTTPHVHVKSGAVSIDYTQEF